MTHLALVALGGAIGASLRHLVNVAALRLFDPAFPVGTLTVNVLGSFAMGLLVAWLALRAEGGGESLRLFLATGVLGGFTTFSAFSLDAMVLWERGAQATALLYVALSVILSIAALATGLWLARSFP
jgi:fluoride exporter